MKKAGIITICTAHPNYGNKLQNYAVQQVLLSLNLSPTTNASERSDLSFKQKIRYRFHKLTQYRFTSHKDIWGGIIARKIAFDQFNKKHMRVQLIDLSNDNLANKEDFFVVGSDQVWNPSWYSSSDKELYLLSFAKPEQKVCFAPSFGLDTLPEMWEQWFAEQLNTFPDISVREEAGANIVKNLTGKNAEVLIDPTLMLNEKEWHQIEHRVKSHKLNNPYLLTYFIGELSEKTKEDIQKLARKHKLTVVSLLDENQMEFSGIGPGEFIWLIHHAALIITDSFHASVFSFIYDRPFLVYPREGSDMNMMSRIYTLLNKFGLERKLVGSDLYNDLFEAKYDYGKKQLESEHKKVIDFLNKSLNAYQLRNGKVT